MMIMILKIVDVKKKFSRHKKKWWQKIFLTDEKNEKILVQDE